MPKNESYSFLLRKASRLWGLQTSFIESSTKKVIPASEKGLKKILADLAGSSTETAAQLKVLIAKRKNNVLQQGLEPSHVKWQGQILKFHFYYSTTDSKVNPKDLAAEITLENGKKLSPSLQILKARLRTKSQDGVLTHHLVLQIDAELPVGYHELTIITPQTRYRTLILSAPNKIQAPTDLHHSWGVFEPLYAVRSKGDWGVGSLRELWQTSEALKSTGAQWIGSLPLLAIDFETKNPNFSPYSAISRIFWNEIYLDVEKLVLESRSERAKILVESKDFNTQIQKLSTSEHVNYKEVYKLKKQVLSLLAEEFFSGREKLDEKIWAQYESFMQESPDLEGYASFRSADQQEQYFHKYVQFQMHRSLSEFHKGSPLGLYMDYPVGVNIQGYDFQKYKDLFFAEVTVGAPPEPAFPGGQDWGFPCLHPLKVREDGYRYFRKTLAAHFRYSKILRIDHVMGLHRLYVKPVGFAGADGAYIRYKPEELFAVVCIEASKYQTDVIGENLGVVPDQVNALLQKRNFNGMTVGQFMLDLSKNKFLANLKEPNLTCMNTHDLPMFAAFLKGEDLEFNFKLGSLSQTEKDSTLKGRIDSIQRWLKTLGLSNKQQDLLLPELLKILAASPSRYLLVNPEDLWQETLPQNIPGVYAENPNWSRKFKASLEIWTKEPKYLAFFQELTRLRKNPKNLPS